MREKRNEFFKLAKKQTFVLASFYRKVLCLNLQNRFLIIRQLKS